MNPTLKKYLNWAVYPAFYFFALFLSIRLTFPYDAIRQRLVNEFNQQQLTPGGSGKRLQIEEASGHWLFGIEFENLEYASPKHAESGGEAGADDGEEKPSVMHVDHAYASISPLRFLFGTTHVSFGLDVGEGEIDGSYSASDEVSELEVEVSEVDVGQLAPLRDIVELPLSGEMNGEIQLTMPERQLKLASGKVDLAVSGLTVGDGKAKIRDTIALPKLEAGDLKLVAEATEGRLDLREFATKGRDFELISEGAMRLRDPFELSLADIALRFKFSDAYKSKNDMTRGLFGAPGSSMPGLFDLDPKIKRAKGSDGFYGWKLSGPIDRLNFRPDPRSSGGGRRGESRRATPGGP